MCHPAATATAAEEEAEEEVEEAEEEEEEGSVWQGERAHKYALVPRAIFGMKFNKNQRSDDATRII